VQIGKSSIVHGWCQYFLLIFFDPCSGPTFPPNRAPASANPMHSLPHPHRNNTSNMTLAAMCYLQRWKADVQRYAASTHSRMNFSTARRSWQRVVSFVRQRWSTFDRRPWPVYHTERPSLCTARCAWGRQRVARVHLRQLILVPWMIVWRFILHLWYV